MALVKIEEKFRDITVIPDKYNTGCDESNIVTIVPDGGISIPCTANGVADTLVIAEASGGTVFSIDWVFNSNNANLADPVVVDNVDFSLKKLVNGNASSITVERNVTFNNCNFLTVGGASLADKLIQIFNDCTSQAFNGSYITLNRVQQTGGSQDAMQPEVDVTMNDSFTYNKIQPATESGQVIHIDGIHAYGSDDVARVGDYDFNNVRYEMPQIEYSENRDGNSIYINSCLSISPERPTTTEMDNVHFNDVVLNGGGYSVYWGIGRAGITMTDTSMDNCQIGESYKYGQSYNTSLDTVVGEKEFTNITDTDKLYVASVWQDGSEVHLSVTNDTETERTLAIVTNIGTQTHTIIACPRYCDNEGDGDGHTYDEYPFDLDINAGSVDYAIAYDITDTGALPDNPDDHIRFVNYTGEDVYLVAENSLPIQFKGPVRADLIECDVAGTPTVGVDYVKQYTNPAIYAVSEACKTLTNDQFGRGDPANLTEVVIEKATIANIDSDQLFVEKDGGDINKWLLYKEPLIDDCLFEVLRYLDFIQLAIDSQGVLGEDVNGALAYGYKEGITYE